MDTSVKIYGIELNPNNLKLKNKYLVEGDDILKFFNRKNILEEIKSDDEFNVCWNCVSKDKIFFGIEPSYPWENKKLYTIKDANEKIADFMFKYFDMDISRDQLKKEIHFIHDLYECY